MYYGKSTTELAPERKAVAAAGYPAGAGGAGCGAGVQYGAVFVCADRPLCVCAPVRRGAEPGDPMAPAPSGLVPAAAHSAGTASAAGVGGRRTVVSGLRGGGRADLPVPELGPDPSAHDGAGGRTEALCRPAVGYAAGVPGGHRGGFGGRAGGLAAKHHRAAFAGVRADDYQ